MAKCFHLPKNCLPQRHRRGLIDAEHMDFGDEIRMAQRILGAAAYNIDMHFRTWSVRFLYIGIISARR